VELAAPGPFVLGSSRLGMGSYLNSRNKGCHDEPSTFVLGNSYLGRGDVLG
jgi:hypothetical protein